MRRTSHVDIEFAADGSLVLSGAARDLCTLSGLATPEAQGAKVRAVLDRERRLVAIEPSVAQPLQGAVVGPGFRAAVADALPEHRAASSALHLLLDDLPVAALISGYAALYGGRTVTRVRDGRTAKADICSGWRSDGTMVVSLRTTGVMPIPHGPPAPSCDTDDLLAWHPMPHLEPGSMRRQRLVDVGPGPIAAIEARFRDTHADPDGNVSVLHEYVLHARFDTATGTIDECRATPVVLPWPECEPAAASASTLDGRRPDELYQHVSHDLRGIGSCTHLNDLLRSLADVPALVRCRTNAAPMTRHEPRSSRRP